MVTFLTWEKGTSVRFAEEQGPASVFVFEGGGFHGGAGHECSCPGLHTCFVALTGWEQEPWGTPVWPTGPALPLTSCGSSLVADTAQGPQGPERDDVDKATGRHCAYI